MRPVPLNLRNLKDDATQKNAAENQFSNAAAVLDSRLKKSLSRKIEQLSPEARKDIHAAPLSQKRMVFDLWLSRLRDRLVEEVEAVVPEYYRCAASSAVPFELASHHVSAELTKWVGTQDSGVLARYVVAICGGDRFQRLSLPEWLCSDDGQFGSFSPQDEFTNFHLALVNATLQVKCETDRQAATEATGKELSLPAAALGRGRRRFVKLPDPVKPVSTWSTRQEPKPTQVPSFPIDYPASLKLKTQVILADTVKEFPNRSDLEQLCRRLVSRLTKLLCTAVREGTLKAHEAPDCVNELLRPIRVANCDSHSHRVEIENAVTNSEEWRAMLKQLVKCQKAQQTRKGVVRKELAAQPGDDHSNGADEEMRSKRAHRRKSPSSKSVLIANAKSHIAVLWKQNPLASQKMIVGLANRHKVDIPWKDCANWDEALVQHPNALKTLLSKAKHTKN